VGKLSIGLLVAVPLWYYTFHLGKDAQTWMMSSVNRNDQWDTVGQLQDNQQFLQDSEILEGMGNTAEHPLNQYDYQMFQLGILVLLLHQGSSYQRDKYSWMNC
jgi:hypothetical protein